MGDQAAIREGEDIGLGITISSKEQPRQKQNDEDEGYKSDDTIRSDDKKLLKKDRTTYDVNDPNDPNKTPKPARKAKHFLRMKESGD